MSKIVIVADDLTGANANGSLLVNKGFSAATCFGKGQWDAGYYSGYDAITLNTDSRLLPQQLAWKKVHESFQLLLSNTEFPKVLSKRIDSTLRGNVGAEIDAALHAIDLISLSSEPALAVVVPAFPASNRLAVGGYLVVNGVPLEQSSIAQDPVRPITTSSFVDIIKQQTDMFVDYIPLKTVMKGAEETQKTISEFKKNGVRIICCDAVTDDDISVIAASLKNVIYPVIAVDPGPFTAALANARVPVQASLEQGHNALVIVGSVTELAQRQVEALRLARNCAILHVDSRSLVNPAKRDQTIADIVKKILIKAGTADVYGVCTAENPDHVLSIDELAYENNIEVHTASECINKGLAEIGEALLEQKVLRIGGIYTSGGEVTVAMSRQLAASGFSVLDEVFPLAVYGRLIGGKYPNLPMVTKGGFVGNNNSVVNCVNYLFTKISAQSKPSS
jgi:Uncharacterized protein conserved in bacteria